MTTLLDLIGIACLSAFAFMLWAPLTLLVAGVACLAISRKAARR